MFHVEPIGPTFDKHMFSIGPFGPKLEILSLEHVVLEQKLFFSKLIPLAIYITYINFGTPYYQRNTIGSSET